ncbi:VF530 family DNA-binding protein [Vogesella mureinivorans]|jgi:uncharacterized protein (DUF2132 family)|uniref:VF530 family protein n=1 Tax=Vogesella mureinivorans TaxID=657276 RepID=UPI0011C92613|nr:VF530 family protein [Vogesella mureinivorans]
MSDKPAPKDPLQGVTLEALLNELVAHHGWPQLGQLVKIRCFNSDPSIKSSLTFLRRTPWARAEVEALYIQLKTPKPARPPRTHTSQGNAPRVLFGRKPDAS